MDQIRVLAARIDNEQKSAMNLLLNDAQRRKTRAEIVSIAASTILAAALCWIFIMTRRHMRERARLLAGEQSSKESLQKALAAERAAHSNAAHANKLKDEFLAVVSHELRTPLNAIVGWTSLLRDGSDKEELSEGLAAIEKNAHAQARLVDDLLDISRIITGKLHLQITEIDMDRTVASVMDTLRPAANARGVIVTLHAGEAPMIAAGDADRMQQIIWNLLSNAIKFTPRGGNVRISLFHEGSDVVLEVRDTGQGIKPEFLPRIFDRFSQQDASTTRKQEGLGLGLSITRQLAELHGGKIIASSEGVDNGATFRLQIPVMAVHESRRDENFRDRDHAAPKSEEEAMPPKSVRNLRILAVDDQSDALAVVSRVLTRAGAEVRTAESVEAALTVLEGWRPDLIISDIGMPEQDGYTFIRVLRNSTDSSLRKVPAIALTAFARENDRFRALGAGFNDHLTKPVHARTLIEKAAEIAGRT
jgi:signal transduction histidine kinase/ActR/RegA family two-component response regulator